MKKECEQIKGFLKNYSTRGWQRMRWLDSIIYSVDMGLNKIRKIFKDREAWMGLQRVGHHWVTEQQQQQRNCACLEQPLAGNQELGCLLSSWNDTFLFLSVSSPTLLTHCSGATKHQREVSKRPQTHTRNATSNLCSPVRGQQLLGGKSAMHPDKSNARTILHIIHSSL